MHSEKQTQSAGTRRRTSWPLTSDVFLFRSRLFRASSLLDVDYQLALRFVLVNWPGRIVDFILFVWVRFRASSPSRGPPRRAESVWAVGGSIGDIHGRNENIGVVEVTSRGVKSPVRAVRLAGEFGWPISRVIVGKSIRSCLTPCPPPRLPFGRQS